jgi:hypothetical protein
MLLDGGFVGRDVDPVDVGARRHQTDDSAVGQSHDASDHLALALLDHAGRFGFGIEPGDPTALAETLDALTAERDRLGPVNLRADIELMVLDPFLASREFLQSSTEVQGALLAYQNILRSQLGNLLPPNVMMPQVGMLST